MPEIELSYYEYDRAKYWVERHQDGKFPRRLQMELDGRIVNGYLYVVVGEPLILTNTCFRLGVISARLIYPQSLTDQLREAGLLSFQEPEPQQGARHALIGL